MTGLQYLMTLFCIFQLKHFLADFPLQGKYMLGKFKPGWDFLGPLSFHCLVHSLLTMAIVTYFTSDVLLARKLAFMDFWIHFFMDRIKAGPKYLGRYKDMYDKKFWWCLGLDQMVHHLTHYFIIYLTVKYMTENV
jgi:hypothetical protein